MIINKNHPLAGLCYVLSEAFYHLYGKSLGCKPMVGKYYGQTHWWLQGPNGEIIDLTAEQYVRPFPYHKGRGCGFLTKSPSKRAKAIIKLIKNN